jgi:GxxExxY protein
MKHESPLDDRTERLATQVIGAAIEVHRELGPGFLETHYEEAMCIELAVRGIPFLRQPAIAVNYKGRSIGEGRLDFLVDDLIVLELKAVKALAPIFDAIVMAYLRATQKRLGLLINFHVPLLKDGLNRIVR